MEPYWEPMNGPEVSPRCMSEEAAEQRVGADERFGIRLQRSQLNPVFDGR